MSGKLTRISYLHNDRQFPYFTEKKDGTPKRNSSQGYTAGKCRYLDLGLSVLTEKHMSFAVCCALSPWTIACDWQNSERIYFSSLTGHLLPSLTNSGLKPAHDN